MTARYAWPQWCGPLTLAVTSVRFDDVPAEVVDENLPRVHLDQVERDWLAVELSLDLSTEETRPAVLANAQCRAYAMLSSSVTNSRIPVVLEEVGTDHWQGRLRATRAELGGVMDLEAYVTAPDPARRPLLRGTSLPWTVVLDAGNAPSAQTRTPVTTVWVDFADVEAPVLCRSYPDAPFAVILEGSTPILYLNSAKKHFQKLLLSEHAQKERRRLRDTFSTIIAATVTRTLVQAAFDEVALNSQGDDAIPPQDPLLRQSCEAVAEVMRSVTDVSDLYARASGAQGSSAELRNLWSEIDLAIGELVSLNSNIIDFAEEVR